MTDTTLSNGQICSLSSRDYPCARVPMQAFLLEEGEDSQQQQQQQQQQPATHLPQFIEDWLGTFTSWPVEHKTLALNAIVSV